MIFPYITAAAAGFLLILQMLLGLAVSGARGKANTWVGDGGNAQLLRATRRHANLAENGAIVLLGLLLLEISGQFVLTLKIMAAVFVCARIVHAIGLSQENTNNPFRLAGGVATYLEGIALGSLLLWLAAGHLWR